MASKLLVSATFARGKSLRFAYRSIHAQERHIIGEREIVGYGRNGQPLYKDTTAFPFPAIRWKEPTAEICELREKEKGDWHALDICEKKDLYRASFCQTFSEMKAFRGTWKLILAGAIFIITSGFWGISFYKLFVYSKDFPESFSEERRRIQLRRLIDMQVNPIFGLASEWDYENNDWKRNTMKKK